MKAAAAFDGRPHCLAQHKRRGERLPGPVRALDKFLSFATGQGRERGADQTVENELPQPQDEVAFGWLWCMAR
jgi:hypothetical protein